MLTIVGLDRYGCKLLSEDKVSMYNFFVAFLGVFYSGQATAIMFQFSTSMPHPSTPHALPMKTS